MSERLIITQENNVEFAKGEREAMRDRLRDDLERQAERSRKMNKNERLDRARHEVESVVHETEQSILERRQAEGESKSLAARRAHGITSQERDMAFSSTINQARSHMSSPARQFSKFIHTKPVEAASEALEKTIARPNSLLYGSMFAFLLTLGVYLTAKHFGYALSGFESIGAFIVGWVLGIIIDYAQLIVRKRRNR